MTPIHLSKGRSATLTAAMVAFFACAALAQQTAEAPGPAMLKAEDAIAIALARQPGMIGEAELDEYEGTLTYDIEVVTEAGQEVEFKIDAVTGDILDRWIDDDPSDDPAAVVAE